jgi:hypothetical protein
MLAAWSGPGFEDPGGLRHGGGSRPVQQVHAL